MIEHSPVETETDRETERDRMTELSDTDRDRQREVTDGESDRVTLACIQDCIAEQVPPLSLPTPTENPQSSIVAFLLRLAGTARARQTRCGRKREAGNQPPRYDLPYAFTVYPACRFPNSFFSNPNPNGVSCLHIRVFSRHSLHM